MDVINWVLEPLQYGFLTRALLVTLAAAVVSAVLSCWLILMGWSLMGDAVSHAVLPGVALAAQPQAELSGALDAGSVPRRLPRNVVLLIADGFGPASATLAGVGPSARATAEAVLAAGATPLRGRRLQEDCLLDTPDGLLRGSLSALRIRMDQRTRSLTLEGTINADRGEYGFSGRRFELTARGTGYVLIAERYNEEIAQRFLELGRQHKLIDRVARPGGPGRWRAR